MKLETFFENFELLTDAPNAVAKLRKIILQLAVMGKLVNHNNDDEDAKNLIKRIKTEKIRLREAKKLRKEEDLTSVKDEDKLYQLPQNWIWCKWNDIALCIGDVDHKMPAEIKEGIPYVSPKDFIEGNGIDFGRAKKISQEDFEALKKKIQPSRGDIIFPRYGTIGENRLVETDIDFLASYSCAVVKNFHSFIEPKYSFYYSLSNLVKKEIERYTNKTTQANVGVKSIKNFIFPLPPLAEQKRIVEKCDRLLSICDEIEKRQQQRQESILRMNESAIAQLLSSQNSDEFRQHWQRICNNFDLLYSVPETIPKLRQAILQLAVQGQLTNQSSKEFKKTSDAHKVSDYITILNGYAFKSTWFINDGIRLLRNANVGHGDLRWDEVARISDERAQEFQRFKLDVDDIVVSLDRPIISTGLKVARITKNDLPCLLLQRVGKFEFKTNEVIPDFFFLWLQSPIFIEAIDPGRSNGVPHISSKSIEAIPFNPPSKDEQKRIVEKCDRLMSLCDTLEAKLKQRRDSSEKLMEVAAKQVLAS